MPGMRWSERIRWTSLGFQRLDRLAAAAGGEHAVGAMEQMAKAFQDVDLVVHDQQGVPAHRVRPKVGSAAWASVVESGLRNSS